MWLSGADQLPDRLQFAHDRLCGGLDATLQLGGSVRPRDFVGEVHPQGAHVVPLLIAQGADGF
ncbi:MAG: hypothetical protein ABSB01_26215 [Streptosporangiaceae bacterium]|jgi:hypothetical protein